MVWPNFRIGVVSVPLIACCMNSQTLTTLSEAYTRLQHVHLGCHRVLSSSCIIGKLTRKVTCSLQPLHVSLVIVLTDTHLSQYICAAVQLSSSTAVQFAYHEADTSYMLRHASGALYTGSTVPSVNTFTIENARVLF